MKPKRGLLGISALAITISLSPFAFAQEDPGRPKGPPVASPSANDQGESMGQSARDSAENGAAEVKKGAENAASKVARTTRRAYHKGTAELRDSMLTAKAKTALLRNEETKHSTIHVSTESGVVTLSGAVNSKERADQAQEVVAQIDGVKNIRNDLTYPGSATAPESSASPEAKIPSASPEPKVAEDPTAPVERVAPPPAER
jgi:BON domain-containing protein